MNMTSIGRRLLLGLAGIALVLTATTPAQASVLTIQFTGLDLIYDGFQICDAGGCAGGFGDFADADTLVGMDFLLDGVPIGSHLSTDIAADIALNISGIPVDSDVTPGGPGDIFDLLTQSSGWGLALDIDEFEVGFFDTTLLISASGLTSDIFFQDLPFGLVMGTPVLFSFEVRIAPGTLEDDGTFITGFDAAGTGQVEGPGSVVPEPTSLVLLGSGLLALGRFARRRRT